MVSFYTDFIPSHTEEVSAFLAFVSKNPKLHKVSINIICMNASPSQYSLDLSKKYPELANFWIVTKSTRSATSEFNIEEPNFTVLVDAPGNIDYMGNLADKDFRTYFGSLVDRGSSKSKYTFNNNLSLFQKYNRKYSKRATPVE